MYITLLQKKNSRQFKVVFISYFRSLHLKTWAELFLELEKTG